MTGASALDPYSRRRKAGGSRAAGRLLSPLAGTRERRSGGPGGLLAPSGVRPMLDGAVLPSVRRIDRISSYALDNKALFVHLADASSSQLKHVGVLQPHVCDSSGNRAKQGTSCPHLRGRPPSPLQGPHGPPPGCRCE